MIFVTVGTHEQPFDRLVRGIDRLKEGNLIREEVFIQSGYSLYRPKFCEWAKFLRFSEVMSKMEGANIIISHAGPATIMLALYLGKTPLVMPREKKYNEHVDNHQVCFCKKLEEEGKVIAAYTVAEMGDRIQRYQGAAKNLEIKKVRHHQRVDIATFVEILDSTCQKLTQKG